MGGRGSTSKSATSNAPTKTQGNGLSWKQFRERHRRWWDDEVPVEYVQDLIDRGLNGYSEYQIYLEEADDYGVPTIVSNEELDKMVDEGAQIIFRGMPDSQKTTGEYKLRDIMEGAKYYTGKGNSGDGLYFGTELDIAGSYASGGYSEKGAVMRAVLKPDAKIIEYSELREQIKELGTGIPVGSGLIAAFARSRGYDVIIGRNDSRILNVLNRSVLVIANELGKADDEKVVFSQPVNVGDNRKPKYIR